MIGCPNTNSKEWKALVEAIGEYEAMRDWMENNDVRSVDTVKNAKPELFEQNITQEIQGTLEANKDRLIDLLGSTMYSEQLKNVVYKELLQNSFDAVKIAQSKGIIEKGKIDIEIDEKERTISFTDNGIGMTPEIVQKAFFTIGGTYKGDDVDNKLKSGGLGLAKMAFIFGSERLILETVNNGVKTTVDATSQEIRNENFKIKSQTTKQKNGTKVSVKIPKTYIDGKGGERQIDFPAYTNVELEYSFLSNPLIGNVDVNYSILNREHSWKKEEKTKTQLGRVPEEYILFSPAKTDFADIDIYIDTVNISRSSSDVKKHRILSSGLYQFNNAFTIFPSDEKIPLNIIIDIKPTVDPTNPQYPFNNQREAFRNTISSDITALNMYLSLLWSSIEIELLKNSFNKIKNIEAVDVENVDPSIIEKNKEITKAFSAKPESEIIKTAVEEFNKKNKEAIIKNGSLKTESISLTSEEVSKNSEKKYSSTFKAEKKISIDNKTNFNLDSNKPIIHNNTDMILDEKAAKFLSEISSIMLEYKKSITDFYGENYSENLKTQLWGVSIDKTYGGVNVKPSFLNMLAINPFYKLPDDPKIDAVNYIAVAIDHLIIHELNHNFVRGEGPDFTGRFLTTYSEVHSLPNHFSLVSKLKMSIKNNLETIKKLNYEYQQSENVESGFEGNKIEQNNKGRTGARSQSISQNDTSIDERAKEYDTRRNLKFETITNLNPEFFRTDPEQFVNLRSKEGFRKLVKKLSDKTGIDYEFISSVDAAEIVTSYGIPYAGEPAFVVDNKVYLIEDKITNEIAFHEFAHPIVDAIERSNPELLEKLYDQLESTVEGQRIIEYVEKLYPELADDFQRFKKEVITKAIGVGAADKITPVETTGFMKFLEDLLFAIKQFFRSIFKPAKIKIENLNYNTKLEDLIEYLVSDKFQLEFEKISREDVLEFFKENKDLETTLYNMSINDNEKVMDAILEAIEKFYNITKDQINLVYRSRNFEEVRETLSDDTKRLDLLGIKQSLQPFIREVEQTDFESIEKFNDFHRERSKAFLYSLNQLEYTITKIENAFNKILAKGQDVTAEDIYEVFYYNKLLKYWDGYLKDVVNVFNSYEFRDVVSNQNLFLQYVQSVHNKVIRANHQTNKIYTLGAKDLIYNQLGDLKKTIDDSYTKAIANAKSDRDRAILKADYEAIKITPEKIEQLIKGELGDAHALNSFLESYMYNQDPIVMGFSAWVKDSYMKLAVQFNEVYNDYIQALEEPLKALGITSNFERMRFAKEYITEKKKRKDANSPNGYYEVYKYLTPYIGHEIEVFELEKDVDDKKTLYIQNVNEQTRKDFVDAVKRLNEFNRAHMHQENVPEYYEAAKLFDDAIGQEAFKRRQEIINKIKTAATENLTTDEILENSDNLAYYWREYRKLTSLFHEDGTPKEGDELLIAERLIEYKDKTKKFYYWKPRKGAFNTAYNVFEMRARASSQTEEEFQEKMEHWIKRNTVKKIKSSFYEERKMLYKQLAELRESLKISNTDREDSEQKLRDLLANIIFPYKDENNQPLGMQMKEGLQEKIKELEERIEKLKSKDSYLTDSELEEYYQLYNYLKDIAEEDAHTVPKHIMKRYKELRAKKESGKKADKDIKKEISAIWSQINAMQEDELTDNYIDVLKNIEDNDAGFAARLYKIYNASIDNLSKDAIMQIFTKPEYVEILIKASDTDLFKEWFYRNHFEKQTWSKKELKSGKITFKKVKTWKPTRAWVVKVPSSEEYIEKTEVYDQDGNVKNVLYASPSLKYFYRTVKDGSEIEPGVFLENYKTPRITYLDCIRDGKPLTEATVDMKGKWLPRNNVERFKDPKYFSTIQDVNKKKLLHTLLLKHYEFQTNLPRESRLDDEIPRYRVNRLEDITNINNKQNPISAFYRKVKSYFGKRADDFEEGLNPEERKIMVNADLFDDEYSKVPITGTYELDIVDTSIDVLSGTMRYFQSGLKQKILLEMLPIAKALQKVLQDPDNNPDDATEEGIKKFHRMKSKIQNRLVPMKKKGLSTRANIINAIIEKEFEGKTNTGFTKDWSSMNKISNWIFSKSAWGYFAFNIPSAIKNSMGARFQSMIEAAGAKHYSWSDYVAGTVWANKVTMEITMNIHKFGNKSLNYQLVEIMDPVQGRLFSTIAERTGTTRGVLQDLADLKFATNIRSWTELNSNLSIFGAMLNKTYVDYLDPQTGQQRKIKYSDAWELKEGVITLKEGVNKDWNKNGKEFNRFVKIVQGLVNNLNGAYSKFDSPEANRYLLFRFIAYLKTYFTRLFMNRWQGKWDSERKRFIPRYDMYTETAELGFYMHTLQYFYGVVQKGFRDWAFLTEDQRIGVKKMLTESLLIFIFGALIRQLIFGFDPDDDEKYEKLRLKSGPLPGILVSESDYAFEPFGWMSNHLLHLHMQIGNENSAWNPFTGADDYVNILSLESVALNNTFMTYAKTMQNMFWGLTGDERAYYEREVGPYIWQDEDSLKTLNYMMKATGFSGTNISPELAIKNLVSISNRFK